MNCSARLHGNPVYRRLALALALAALVFTPATAGDAGPPMALPVSELFPGAQFDPTVPAQAKLFGFQPGERPIRHHELVEFMRALADSSPRAELREYARTYEGRPLVYLAISDAKTISGLRGFHKEHARLVDPRERAAGDDAALIEQAKAVAWMAYSIHGNEVIASLASAAVEATRSFSRSIIDWPCRFPMFFRSTPRPPWPTGSWRARTNWRRSCVANW